MVEPVARPSSMRMIVRPRTSTGLLAAGQLAALVGDRVEDLVGRDVHGLEHLVVHHDDVAGGDRAHGQLLVARRAELADEEDVERRAQFPGHLVGDRHAAARQGQHDDVVEAGVVGELPGQEPPGLRPIPEWPAHGPLLAARPGRSDPAAASGDRVRSANKNTPPVPPSDDAAQGGLP
jgi:hypothetical protein